MCETDETGSQQTDEVPHLRQRLTELEALDAEHRQVEATLRERTDQMRQMMSAIHEVVWLRDTKTLEILYVNPAYEALWGRTCESLYKDPTSFVDAVHPDDKARVMQAIEKQREGIFFNEIYRIIRPDGSMRWVRGRTFPITNESGEVYRMVALVEDITARKQAEDESERLITELEAFAETVAHDLKNPLTMVMGYSDLLQQSLEPISNQKIEQNLQFILRAGSKMESIIDSLLLFAGVRKEAEVKVEPLDTASIVAEALSRLANQVAGARAQITMPDTWPSAIGYAPWIEEVWVNYLSNAIKYGGQPPLVMLGAHLQPDGRVRFWVSDNGRGLKAEEQLQLFMQYTRVNEISIEGYGLGLSIVRRIVERLGGEVGVESEGLPGRGSVFYFMLPGTA